MTYTRVFDLLVAKDSLEALTISNFEMGVTVPCDCPQPECSDELSLRSIIAISERVDGVQLAQVEGSALGEPVCLESCELLLFGDLIEQEVE